MGNPLLITSWLIVIMRFIDVNPHGLLLGTEEMLAKVDSLRKANRDLDKERRSVRLWALNSDVLAGILREFPSSRAYIFSDC